MKTTVNKYDFRRAFLDIRPDQFSLAALDVLFEYFEQYEQDTEQEIELDVIAICCDFQECSIEEIAADYGIEITGLDDDEQQEKVEEFLRENTCLVGESHIGHLVYQSF